MAEGGRVWQDSEITAMLRIEIAVEERKSEAAEV
jgi:hypothetical protein